jgi:hypothetical protein
MENLKMLRHGAVAEAEEIEQGTYGRTNDDLIPLSVLQLDLDPGEPWAVFLARRGIAFRPDRIGRDAVTAGDAQRLLAERRADELRQQQHLKVAEEEAVAADQARRALIWKGVPADALPVGVSASSVMLQAAKEAEPKRTTPLEHALSIRARWSITPTALIRMMRHEQPSAGFLPVAATIVGHW